MREEGPVSRPFPLQPMLAAHADRLVFAYSASTAVALAGNRRLDDDPGQGRQEHLSPVSGSVDKAHGDVGTVACRGGDRADVNHLSLPPLISARGELVTDFQIDCGRSVDDGS